MNQTLKRSRNLMSVLALVAACLPLVAAAQVECWAPQENQDKVGDKRFAVQLGWMKKAEQIIRRNSAFMTPPEPVRMRSTVAAGPYHPSGARLHVRAYPEKSTVGIQVWAGACDVIAQAERISASVGRISVFFNIDVGDMFLLHGSPKFEGMVGGYPRYNGWVVITREGRLPWIPQTLAERLDAEAGVRQRRLAEARQQIAEMKLPDSGKQREMVELIRKSDPAGAEALKASLAETERELNYRKQVLYPAQIAQFEKAVADLAAYRTSFGAEELRMPAVWTDGDGAGRRRMDARIEQLQRLSAEDEQAIKSRSKSAAEVRNAHRDRVAPLIADAMAEYDLAYLRPGPAAEAVAHKPDREFLDLKRQPDRLKLIAVLFSEDPRKQRGPWMQAAKAEFDFAALAAMLD